MGSHPTELTDLLLTGGDRDVFHQPAKFLVDWRRLFAIPGDSSVVMPARQFTPQFVPAFRRMRTSDGQIDMALNMLGRDETHHLISGQQLADSYGIARLTSAEMVQGAPAQQRDVLRQHPDLTRATPLWYYVMLESQIREDGQRLGPTGSRLLLDAFLALPRIDEVEQHRPWTEVNSMGELIAALQSEVAHLWSNNA